MKSYRRAQMEARTAQPADGWQIVAPMPWAGRFLVMREDDGYCPEREFASVIGAEEFSYRHAEADRLCSLAAREWARELVGA